MKEKNKEKGTIIIEASIILPIFMFLFLCMYSVINICFIEIKVQNALNNSARKIGEYSYIYAFSGVKDKMNNVKVKADNKKKEIKESVIDNFATVMDSLGNISNGASSAYTSITSGAGLGDLINTAKAAGNDAQAGLAAGKAIVSYVKNAASDPKAFATSIITIFASDLGEIVKHTIAGALAEWVCSDYLDPEFAKTIDYSKSFMFPGTSSDIILVAEYEVRIAPYLPLEINYNISQQAVTRGWLDGDGAKVDKNGLVDLFNSIDAILHPDKQNNIWTSEGGLTLNERSKAVRDSEIKKLENQGYYSLRGNSDLHMYNPTTNTFVCVGSSNALYDMENVESLEEAINNIDEEQIKDYMLNTIAKFDTTIDSAARYKVKNGSSSTTMVEYPYELQEKKGIDIKKEFVLVVPQDEGLAAKYQEIWDSIPEKQREGITLNLKADYGKNYKTYDKKKEN